MHLQAIVLLAPPHPGKVHAIYPRLTKLQWLQQKKLTAAKQIQLYCFTIDVGGSCES